MPITYHQTVYGSVVNSNVERERSWSPVRRHRVIQRESNQPCPWEDCCHPMHNQHQFCPITRTWNPVPHDYVIDLTQSPPSHTWEGGMVPETPPPSPDISTGNSSSVLRERSASRPLEQRLGHSTLSQLDLMPLQSTFGRTILTWREPDLNLENCRLKEVTLKIGRESLMQQRQPGLMTSRQTYWLDITAVSRKLVQSIANLLLLNEKLSCIGAQQSMASLNAPGRKRRLRLTLKILGPNFGMATEINKTLSSMSSAEVLTSPTCCDGPTDTPSLWKLRVPVWFYKQKESGSLPTYHQENGGLI